MQILFVLLFLITQPVLLLHLCQTLTSLMLAPLELTPTLLLGLQVIMLHIYLCICNILCVYTRTIFFILDCPKTESVLMHDVLVPSSL